MDSQRGESAENLPTFLAILAAFSALRLAANLFSNTELFFDEAQYWFWSRELAFGYYSKPPLIGWIIRGATEICGQGEACIREPVDPLPRRDRLSDLRHRPAAL